MENTVLDEVQSQPQDWLSQVCEDPFALKSIPKSQQTDEMVLAAIVETAKGDPHLSLNDETIAKARMNKNVMTELVEKNPWRLSEIPEKKMSRAIVLAAVKNSEGHPEVLSMVPKRFATKPIYALAVEEEPLALQYVPDANKNRKMCTSAVERNPKAIQWVPRGLISPKLRKAAEKELGDALSLEAEQEASLDAEEERPEEIAPAENHMEETPQAAPLPQPQAKRPRSGASRANPIKVRFLQMRGL